MAPENDMAAQMQIIHTFGRTCYPPWYMRVKTRILRPERPEYSMIMSNEDDNATAKRETVFRILHNSLVGKTKYHSFVPFAEKRCIITAVTAILFDQECSSRGCLTSGIITETDPAPLSSLVAPPLSFLSMSGQSGARMVASLIEHMLLIDYGIAERPLRPLDPEPAWMTNYMTRVVCHGICKRLVKFTDDCRNGKEIQYSRVSWLDDLMQSYEAESSADFDFSDVGLMLYYYWTRRREISREQYLSGLTGYTGVLDEMLSEIPIVGKNRLIRKLSVDVNKFIPRYVKYKGTRDAMIAKAVRIAGEQGIHLRAPVYAFESLSRPSTPTIGSSARNVAAVRASRRNGNRASLEGYETPPPSYSEAMSLSGVTNYTGRI